MIKRKKYTLKERCERLLKMKLVIPVLRSTLPPEVKAMGVAVGLFWAMTPLVGIQMWIEHKNKPLRIFAKVGLST